MHAARLSWQAGRARDEENTRATALASDVIDTALRIVHLICQRSRSRRCH